MTFSKQAMCGAGLMALLFAGDAAARDIAIPMDEVRIVTFPVPVSTVYVGNPVIADVTVIDSRRVFVLGKSFGSTNLIALDTKGNPTVSERLTVYARQGTTVTLHRGPAQSTYACAGTRCEASPVPGDETGPFNTVVEQREKLTSQSAQAATGQQR